MKKTGYFIEDHADVMERLRAGTATADDQKKAANALQQADLYEDVYNNCTDQIEPYVHRTLQPEGTLPATLTGSLDILLEFWLKHKDKPDFNATLLDEVQRGLEVGASYGLKQCSDALAKLTEVKSAGNSNRRRPNGARLEPGFPARLKAARLAIHMSLEELSSKAFLPIKHLEAYEEGTMTPQRRTVKRLMRTLGTDTTLVKGSRPQHVIAPNKERGHDEEME